ncbi:GNAT family N-acetyltransferase [Nocardiopsis sp. HNM0947]|uniref:GNAT family N-acetyltransferase n=1 Tax=Nocardiopsis coralli TaxID=2772213 RepID=A0ABR9PCK7_9ACTN|nr:GNAT family N-acetyltransferase [Nocardiopsis coralli]MBE3001570.1 GNAT family N-acetyltransferase [Nocardiopsis coralli]
MVDSAGRGPDPAWTVRAYTEADHPAYTRVISEALLLDRAGFRRHTELHPVSDHGRVLVATDGQRVVGTAQALELELTLPQGPRPVAGITAVGVWPTHRRRGVLSALMRRQIADAHERGEKVAALWSSEGGIYDRFGYGQAVFEQAVGVDRRDARLRSEVPREEGLSTELREAHHALPDLLALYRKLARGRVGQIARTVPWFEYLIGPQEEGRNEPLAVVVRDADAPRGYALYRTESHWDGGLPRGKVVVQELGALDPPARTALYEHLFSRDLTTRVEFAHLPLDEPLPLMLEDGRLLRRGTYDSLWLRLVDLPAALAERTWAAPVDAVLAVTDRYAPWNEGTWRLRAGPEGATVESTDRAPEVSLDAAHLGAAYLGQVRLSNHRAAGALTEHEPGTVERLDTALFRPAAPYCGTAF